MSFHVGLLGIGYFINSVFRAFQAITGHPAAGIMARMLKATVQSSRVLASLSHARHGRDADGFEVGHRG